MAKVNKVFDEILEDLDFLRDNFVSGNHFVIVKSICVEDVARPKKRE